MAAVALPTRTNFRRNSPLSGLMPHGFSADAPVLKRIEVAEDSDSDDEPPPEIKFSKVTQALLADAGVASSQSRRGATNDIPRFNRSTSAGTAGLDTPSRASGFKVVRRVSPSGSQGPQARSNTPPRVVHLGSKGLSSAKRSISISGPYPQRNGTRRDPTPESTANREVVTPAQPRAIRVVTRSRAGSNASQDDPAHLVSSISRPGSRNGTRAAPDTGERRDNETDLGRSTSTHHASDATTRYGASTRSRNPSTEPAAPPGSQRIKRAPNVTGTFLRSGPVRRGFKRRDSEENISPNDEVPNGSSSQPSASTYTPQDRSISQLNHSRRRSGSVNNRATSVEPISVHDFANQRNPAPDSRPPSRQANPYFPRSQTSSESRPPSRQGSHEVSRSRQPSVERNQVRRKASAQQMDAYGTAPAERRSSLDQRQAKPTLEQKPLQKASGYERASYRYVHPKAHMDASEDQENVPPPTFRRNKDQEFKYLGKSTMSVMSDDEKPKGRLVEETPVPKDENRKALGLITGNTPHRTAPAPPPKMSILETATAAAGASTTKSRKKRQHIVVKGKIFTQMGKIGKGGSSDVYCVMAENYKTYALKRVKLEDCDENTVRGYKGEIDLLESLQNAERVVSLIDWELNEEKQELIVLMEKGDSDLNRVLGHRLSGDARFDSVFTRFYWKEMLECVQEVHKHDIVHSDLKPANFLSVAGKLKLIDFGIANAIDTDNTCNVHRESHVGTPNYMSPESITDTNAGSGKDAAGRPLKKDMRIGKASDVWSLGCILYQMAYGRPPFAHITNQITRIMAITNPKHAIEFPETGIGGVRIPTTLRGTLRRCLDRNPEKRPLIKDLLSESDPFMNPEGTGNAVLMDEQLLGQIIGKVIERCRDAKRGVPTPEEASQYPRSFMVKIRQMQEGQ